MTSQSPTDTEATEEYEQAWSSIQELTRTQGISWSGGEKNHVFLNNGDGTFCDVSATSHADFADDGRAVTTLDWDGDGRLDLLLRSRTAPRFRLMLNQAEAGNFVALRLRGTQSNRDAIGAQVFVHSGNRVLRQTLQAGDSFLSQSSKTLHFGLGNATTIDQVRVVWPNGNEQTFEKLRINRVHGLEEGAESSVGFAMQTHVSLASAEATPVPRAGNPVVRIPLIEKIPLHALPIPSEDHPDRTIADLGPGPTLINLWGINCVNCLKEFGAFQRRAEQISGRGLRVVPLNTDGPENRARADEMLTNFGLQKHAGYTNETFMQSLEAVLYEVLGTPTGTPLPTSLLLDADGQLCVVYQGKVKMGDLLRDAAIVATMDARNTSAAKLHFGTRLKKRDRNWTFLAKAFESYGLHKLAADYRTRAEHIRR
ncbi:MAG: ASPIC/UnbV domain-containing protein [Planctomycetes bacterium]|nr:ASPIC/UnbV domain-containing protein [Planctomycetota bacterium]